MLARTAAQYRIVCRHTCAARRLTTPIRTSRQCAPAGCRRCTATGSSQPCERSGQTRLRDGTSIDRVVQSNTTRMTVSQPQADSRTRHGANSRRASRTALAGVEHRRCGAENGEFDPAAEEYDTEEDTVRNRAEQQAAALYVLRLRHRVASGETDTATE